MPSHVIIKKQDEKPLPVPFVFPSNYRPEVELGLKSGRMSKDAKKHYLSSVAAAMYSYKKYVSKLCHNNFILCLGILLRKNLLELLWK